VKFDERLIAGKKAAGRKTDGPFRVA